MKKNRKRTVQGWAILSAFTAVLIVLKITGVTTLSWLWVFFPLWLPVAVATVIVLALVILWLLWTILDAVKGGRNGRK